MQVGLSMRPNLMLTSKDYFVFFHFLPLIEHLHILWHAPNKQRSRKPVTKLNE